MLKLTASSISPKFSSASWLARHIYDQEITVPETMKTFKKEQLVPVLQACPSLKNIFYVCGNQASSST